MLRRPLLGVLAVALTGVAAVSGAGLTMAAGPPSLSGHGPTAVAGTDATAVFRLGGRTVRQVRYRDRGTLVYSFSLANDGRLPVRVVGLARLEREPRLFRLTGLADADGDQRFTIPAGDRVPVRLRLLMRSCETLSARAGSFATHVRLRVTRAGWLDDVVEVELPEELHTGSPREASCPRATATSRPPG